MIKLVRTRGFARALLVSIVAAGAVPGGAAVSSYSYPPPPPPPQFAHSVTLEPPWSDGHHFEDPSCGLLSKCDASATAKALDGNMVSDSTVLSPLKGLGPDTGSSAEADGTLHFVDHFSDPNVRVVLYRFYLSVNHVAYRDSSPLPHIPFVGPYRDSQVYVDLASGSSPPRYCVRGFHPAKRAKGVAIGGCNEGDRVYLWPDALGLVKADVYVRGVFNGRQDNYVRLTTLAGMPQGSIGRSRTFADVSLVQVDRLW